MASMRTSAFQTLLRSRTPLLRSQQRRWAQVHDVRFLATHHDPKHVLDKYKSKLDQKAKQEGHSNIDSLKNAYQDKIDDLRKDAATPITPDSPSAPQKPSSTGPPPPPRPASPLSEAVESQKGSAIKPLSSYLDVEKIAALPPKEIEALWRLRFADSPTSICAAIPLDAYRRIADAARQNPQFILPLPRQHPPGAENTHTPPEANEQENSAPAGPGADIHFLQWGFHPPASAPPDSTPSHNNHTSTIIFTQLASYKLHGSYATPHTTITHHLDLADEKGLVLMHGQVMPDSGVSTTEATWLVSCVQRFYDFGGRAEGRKGELVKMFTRGDVQNFKVEELVEEVERF